MINYAAKFTTISAKYASLHPTLLDRNSICKITPYLIGQEFYLQGYTLPYWTGILSERLHPTLFDRNYICKVTLYLIGQEFYLQGFTIPNWTGILSARLHPTLLDGNSICRAMWYICSVCCIFLAPSLQRFTTLRKRNTKLSLVYPKKY